MKNFLISILLLSIITVNSPIGCNAFASQMNLNPKLAINTVDWQNAFSLVQSQSALSASQLEISTKMVLKNIVHLDLVDVEGLLLPNDSVLLDNLRLPVRNIDASRRLHIKVKSQTGKRQLKGSDLNKCNEVIEQYNRLINSNFESLELFSCNPESINKAFLYKLFKTVDNMIQAYSSMAEIINSPIFLREAENIKKQFEGIKQDLLQIPEDRLSDSENIEKITHLKEPRGENLYAVTTVHDMIRYLHQRSFVPLIDLVKDFNSGMTVDYQNQTFHIIDLSTKEAIKDGVVYSDVLRAVFDSFPVNRYNRVRGEYNIVLKDNLIIIDLPLGIHRAELVFNLAPPELGGGIWCRYFEPGVESGRQKRLSCLAEIVRKFGMHAEIKDSMFLNIQYDKNYKLRFSHQLTRGFIEIMRLLSYTLNLDAVFDANFTVEDVVEFYLKYRKMLVINQEFRSELSEPHKREINQWLSSLDLTMIPDVVKVNPNSIYEFINGPISRGLNRGEFIWKIDENTGRQYLKRNPNFRPFYSLLKDLDQSEESAKQARQMGDVLGLYHNPIKIEPFGTVGKYLACSGDFYSDNGELMHVTAIKDQLSGAYIFARIISNKNLEVALTPVEAQKIMRQKGWIAGEVEKIESEEIECLKQGLCINWPRSKDNIELPVSPVSQGIARGELTQNINADNKDRKVLMRTNIDVKDMQKIDSFSGVITTRGGSVSHNAILLRERGIPAIDIPNAERVTQPDGRQLWQLTLFNPVDEYKTPQGFVYSLDIKEKNILFDPQTTQIWFDGAKGVLRIGLSAAESAAPVNPESRTHIIQGADRILIDYPSMIDSNAIPYIIPLSLINSSFWQQTGPKAANLGEISGKTTNGLVADGFSVTYKTFIEFIRLANIKEPLEGILNSQLDYDEKEKAVMKLFSSIKGPAVDMLEDLIIPYTHQKGNWAVRSSKLMEDSASASFAGLGRTDLGVSNDELVSAIIQNFAGFITARSLEYQAKHKINYDVFSHAVFVQKMVDTDIAGVIFGSDPASLRSDVMVINSSLGLCKSVVDGAVQPDQYKASKKTGVMIEPPVIGDKVFKYIMKKDGSVGRKLIPYQLRRKSTLNREQIKKLTLLVGEIEDHFGCPVDIEFGIKSLDSGKDEIYILQVRPITTLNHNEKAVTDLLGLSDVSSLKTKKLFKSTISSDQYIPIEQKSHIQDKLLNNTVAIEISC